MEYVMNRVQGQIILEDNAVNRKIEEIKKKQKTMKDSWFVLSLKQQGNQVLKFN